MATKAAISRTAARPAQAQQRISLLQRGLLYALAILCAIGFTVPFIWTIGTSLKPLTDLYTYPPKFVPSAPRWDNYTDVFTLAPFATFLWNSVIITALRDSAGRLSGFAKITLRLFFRLFGSTL